MLFGDFKSKKDGYESATDTFWRDFLNKEYPCVF